MKLRCRFLIFVFVGMLVGCMYDPVEKCVKAQINVADEQEKEAAEQLKRDGRTVDWGKFGRGTATQVEARARLQCLKAASCKLKVNRQFSRLALIFLIA